MSNVEGEVKGEGTFCSCSPFSPFPVFLTYYWTRTYEVRL